jgi:hypothetical protein
MLSALLTAENPVDHAKQMNPITTTTSRNATNVTLWPKVRID